MNHLPKHMLSHKVSLHKSQRTENILRIFSEHSRIKLEISKTRNFKTPIYWTIKQITEVPLCPSSPPKFSYLGGWQREGQEQRMLLPALKGHCPHSDSSLYLTLLSFPVKLFLLPSSQSLPPFEAELKSCFCSL